MTLSNHQKRTLQTSSPLEAINSNLPSFLLGDWLATQVFPTLGSGTVSYEDWEALPNGELHGRSYSDPGDPNADLIEIWLRLTDQGIIHELRGDNFNDGHLMRMPVVQMSKDAITSVNSYGSEPRRTSYDQLNDGTIIASIFLESCQSVIVYNMVKRQPR